MKFSIASQVLTPRLAALGRVIMQKNSTPLHECFLFQIAEGRLQITATDTENTLLTSLPLSEGDGTMAFCLPAATLLPALKEVPEQPLDFYVSEATLEVTIEYQAGEYHLAALPADAFPLPPEGEQATETIQVPAEHLLSALTRSTAAAAVENTRPVMTGSYFDRQQNALAIVASDGSVLALTRIGLDAAQVNAATGEVEDSNHFNLPPKPAALLRSLLTKEVGMVSVTFDGRQARIDTEQYTLHCRLIEGRYPNYATVIPKNNDNHITISRTALMSTLRRMLVCTTSGQQLVKMRIEEGQMVVSAQNLELSQTAKETILCSYSGTPITIGFKGPMLLGLLSGMEGENVVMKLADATRPAVFVPEEQQKGEEVLMMIVPLLVD